VDNNPVASFVAQTGVTGSSGYGTFSVDTSGQWTYAMKTGHDEFVGGTTYTDSFTVKTADGASKVVTVSMLGTDDTSTISGVYTAALTETDTALSTGGKLLSSDIDSPVAAAFVEQSGTTGTNGYGSFSIDASGKWSYTMNSAHDEFVKGTTYTDSFTASTADGTSQVV
jgi:VCBS repeat-containing protein